MANLIEIILKARDEASAKLKAARSEISKTTEIVNTLAPSMGAAGAQVSQFATAAGAMGPAGLAIAGVAASVGILVGTTKEMAQWVRELADATEQLGNLSQKTGVAMETLGGLQAAFTDAGVSTEALNTGLRFLSKAIAEDDPALKMLGITTKDVGEAFFQLSDVFAANADGSAKANFAIQVLGRSGTDLIPVMNAGGKELREMAAASVELGRVLGSDGVRSMQAADEQLDALGAKTAALKTQVTLLAAPAITGLVSALNDLLGAMLSIPAGIDAAAASMRAFVNSSPTGKALLDLIAFANAMERIGNAIDGGEARKKAGGSMDSGGFAPPPAVMFGPGNLEGIAEFNKHLKDPPAAKGLAQIAREMAAAVIPLTEGTGKLREASVAILEVGAAVEEVATQPVGLGALLEVFADFRDSIDAMLEPAAMLRDSLGAMLDGLTSGFQQVFTGLLSGAMSFAMAMRTVFSSLVSAVLSELARLAAAKVFGLLIRLAMGAASGGASVAIESIKTGGGFAMAPAGGAESAARAGSGGTTIYLSTIDQKSWADQYRSNSSGMRLVEDRLAMAEEF